MAYERYKNKNKTVKNKKSKNDEYTLDEAMEDNGVTAPKWLMKIGVGLVVEVMIAGVVADCYGVYRLFVWLF